ncbi:MAG TPA: ATP-binding protein [Acidimicrobiia bacterium]|nr:ATP-binding protein [Acidimicrobiia bacterium]
MSPYEILASLPYFSGLSEEQLTALCQTSESMAVEKGTEVITEGGMPSGLFVIAEGTFRVSRRGGGAEMQLRVATPGDVLGEMSLIGNVPATATVRALERGTLIKVPADEFREALADPVLLAGMFHTVTGRLREQEAALVESEKLASLGSWAAGLLHEVNNPAAAVLRAAEHLTELTSLLVPGAEPVTLRPLARAEREQAMAELLAAAGESDPGELAASLVTQGWTPEQLAEAGPDPATRLRTARLVHARQLATELGQAARRISELVGAVKRWSYHGQGEVQAVDLNQVVTDSLTLLRHQVGNLQVELDLDPDLGLVEARGVGLSQVVTNLIDNALQAAAHRVTVRTRPEIDTVTVEVEDDGPGIPDHVRERIWDPFFTTKPPGKGSGLGLAIVRRIVSEHDGSISVESAPGATKFSVTVPRAAQMT